MGTLSARHKTSSPVVEKIELETIAVQLTTLNTGETHI